MTQDTKKRSYAGLAGAATAGLALGLTELMAGFFAKVPSAISAVGGLAIDRTPGFVERIAIDVFGTADKGVLGIMTVVVGVLVGYFIGRAAWTRPSVADAGFGVFAIVGVLASLQEPLISPVPSALSVLFSAAAGWLLLRATVGLLHAPEVATPTDGVPLDAGRRRFATTVAGAGAVGLFGGFAGRRLTIDRSERVRESTGLPVPETPVAPPGSDQSFDIEGLESIVVSTDDFYRIDTALVVPRPSADSWTLTIKGLVDKEVEFTLDDLFSMELHERYVTISCVSNNVGGDLVGNAKWTGVRLVELLDRAGVHNDASQIVGRSVDGWTAGFPTEVAYDGRDPLLAVGMNGGPLPPAHGYPARLIVPGLYGYVSATKWIEEIELTRWDDFDGYWISRGWSKSGPIKTQSRIDTPRRGQDIPGSPAVLAGVAWAPLKRVERVEVSIDDGGWLEADLTSPLSDAAWVQWKVEAPLGAGTHTAKVRATDGTGETQTEKRSSVAPDGATGWHGVTFDVIA